MKILLVEDNKELCSDITEFLGENGYLPESVSDFVSASEKLNTYKYDLIILDLGLPDGNGLDLIEEIRTSQTNAGIIIVTAKNALEEKIRGLDLGADDYLTKPFHLEELNARIRAIIRRNKFDRKNVIIFEELEIDTIAATLIINTHDISLTKKEYDLLLFFLDNHNRMITKESIAEHLWGDVIDQSDNFDFVYNHIKNLRKKIMSQASFNYIHSMYGMGYKFYKGKKK